MIKPPKYPKLPLTTALATPPTHENDQAWRAVGEALTIAG